MKPQLRLTRLLLRFRSSGAGAQGGFGILRPFTVPTQTARKFSFGRHQTRAGPSLPVPTSCHRQLGYAQPRVTRRRVRGTAFSTSPPRRSADYEGGKSAGELKEGTQGTAATGGKAAYPERLIVYHAGTAKTTFLACLKVTTLFVFGFFDMIVTPAYLSAGEPLVRTAGVALCGIIPAVYVAWSTSPFVATIHLHLPPYARWSRAILERFARTAPPNTRVDVTTMSLIGKPRVSSMVLSDLRPASRRLGTVNYVRDTTLADANRRWWRFRAVAEFNVPEGGEKQVKNGWVWEEIREGIARRSAGPGSGEKGRQ